MFYYHLSSPMPFTIYFFFFIEIYRPSVLNAHDHSSKHPCFVFSIEKNFLITVDIQYISVRQIPLFLVLKKMHILSLSLSPTLPPSFFSSLTLKGILLMNVVEDGRKAGLRGGSVAIIRVCHCHQALSLLSSCGFFLTQGLISLLGKWPQPFQAPGLLTWLPHKEKVPLF